MKTAIFRTISTEELLAKYEVSLTRKANEISHLQQVVELQDKIILKKELIIQQQQSIINMFINSK